MRSEERNVWETYRGTHLARDLERLGQRIAKLRRDAQAEKDDQGVAAMLADDADRLTSYREAVASNDAEHASRLAYWMDTACRDEIPARLYNAVEAAA